MEATKHARRSRIEPSLVLGLALLALTILAGVLRWQALSLGPQALYRDEAQNGLDALRVLEGARPIYFEANNGREPLFIYLAALSVSLFGRSPDALRVVSVLIGTLTVPALYWLGTELYGGRVGLLTAILAVTTVWTLNLSRVAFRAGLLPLVASLALAAAWRAQRRRSPGWAVIGGALFGLSLYTYLAARAIPIAIGLYLLWCLLDRKTRRETWWQGWAITLVVALAVSGPLLAYLLRTGGVLSRSDQVSIFNPAINAGDLWGTLAKNAGRTFRSLVYGGDFIPRHNVPWRAVFAPVPAAAAYAGLGLLVIRSRRETSARLVLAWLVALALPTILAEGAPHFLRGVGLLPGVLLLPGVALDALLMKAPRHWRQVVLAVATLALVWGASSDWGAYRAHLASPAVYYEFETGAAELAATVNRHLGSGWQGNELSVGEHLAIPGREVWIARRLWDQFPSIRYLVDDTARVRLIDEGHPAPKPSSNVLMVVVWPFVDHSPLWTTLPLGWQWEVTPGAREQGDLDPDPRLLYLTLRGEPAGAWTDVHGATFRDGLALEGIAGTVTTDTDGTNDVSLVLRWRADGQPGAAYNAFVHVYCSGALVGQSDGPPAGEWFPTAIWRPGDVVLDRRSIVLSLPWDPVACSIQLGLYSWQNGARLSLADPGVYRSQDNAIVVDGQAISPAR